MYSKQTNHKEWCLLRLEEEVVALHSQLMKNVYDYESNTEGQTG